MVQMSHHAIKKKLMQLELSKSKLPTIVVPEGIDYFFGRRKICDDVIGNDRIPELLAKGWTFVPPGRHPGLNEKIFTYKIDCIEYGNLVLLERSKLLREE